MSLGFRPVVESDQPLLLALYASTRQAELELVPWSQEQKAAFVQMQFTAQSQHYVVHYPQSEHLVVLWAGAPVGRIWVDRAPEKIHVLDFTLLAAYQQQGIGTTVLTGLIDEGARTGRPISIYLDLWSPAVSLFERLGFAKVSDHGHQILVQWSPASVQIHR